MKKNDGFADTGSAANGRKTEYVPVWTEVILLDCDDVIRTSSGINGRAFDADGEELE